MTNPLALTLLLFAFQQDSRVPTPIRQAPRTVTARVPLTIEDASRNDRWLGLGVRDVRWSPDGSLAYFRWSTNPQSDDLPEADPWFRVDAAGQWAEPVPASETALVPGAVLSWSRSSRQAAWADGSSLYLFDGTTTRRIATLTVPIVRPRFARADAAIEFEADETLYRYDLGAGSLAAIAIRATVDHPAGTEAARQLARQQRELFPSVRQIDRDRDQRAALARQRPDRPLAIPAPTGTKIDLIDLSPDGRFLTFRATARDPNRPPTKYLDYLDPSGYSNGNGPARGRMAMPPSNSMNMVNTTGLYRLAPRTTRLREIGSFMSGPCGRSREVRRGAFSHAGRFASSASRRARLSAGQCCLRS